MFRIAMEKHLEADSRGVIAGEENLSIATLSTPVNRFWRAAIEFGANTVKEDLTMTTIADIGAVGLRVLPKLSYNDAASRVYEEMESGSLETTFEFKHIDIDTTHESEPDIWAPHNIQEEPLAVAELIDTIHINMPGNRHPAKLHWS
jgi:hypothetical protein